MASVEKSTDISMGVPLCIAILFSLIAFRILRILTLYLTFSVNIGETLLELGVCRKAFYKQETKVINIKEMRNKLDLY